MDALPAVITGNLDAIRAACVEYYVKRLAVFGSAAKGTFDPARSDAPSSPHREPNWSASCI